MAGWVKIIDHLSGDDLEGFVHGHRDQYYDKHGNPTGQAKGFFSIDFDDDEGGDFADCPIPRQTRSGMALTDYTPDEDQVEPTPTPTLTPTTPSEHPHHQRHRHRRPPNINTVNANNHRGHP